jgi:hypothetical protein
MDQDREKVAMEAQLARCRELAKQYPPDGITGRNIRFLTDELERKVRAMDQ